MLYTKPSLVVLCESESLKQSFDPAIPCAIIECMSEWHPELILATLDAYSNPSLSFSTQAESIVNYSTIGLMQFTGSQARLHGYKQDMDGLLYPETNLEIGIKILKMSIEATNNKLDRALVTMYGYRITGLLPKVFSKIRPYHDFLNSELRPKSA
jgi:hypothetical protein